MLSQLPKLVFSLLRWTETSPGLGAVLLLFFRSAVVAGVSFAFQNVVFMDK